MKAAIAVCGRFHYLNYAPMLASRGVLDQIYFSHRVGAGERAGLPPALASNFPIKEYLTQGHQRIFGAKGQEFWYAQYNRIWEAQVLQRWKPSNVLHFLANGTCRRIVERAKADGCTIIAEVVNTHPENRAQILSEEASSAASGFLRDRHHETLIECGLADVLLAPSAVVKESFTSRGIGKPIFTIPYGANLNRFAYVERNCTKERRLKVVCVGQVGYRKGQKYLIEAAKTLGPDVEVTLIGPKAAEAHLILESLPANVRYLGALPSSEIPRVLADHDAFVLASLEEGLAVSICEAMATGMPVIATRESGADEVIENGVTGLIVNSRSSGEIANALGSLFNADFRRGIGLRARRSVEQYANWEVYAEKVWQLYEEIHN